MKKKVLSTLITFLACALVAARVDAQIHNTIKWDRVEFSNGEFVPRFAQLPHLARRLVVAEGKIYNLRAEENWDAIEVAGTLRVDPSLASTVVKTTHLLVLPGGQLDWQVACGKKFELIFNDVPVDLERDPFQWGNGLVNLGTSDRRGCPIPKTFLQIAQDAHAGDTALVLTEPPTGWRVGDELVIPDSATPNIPAGGQYNDPRVSRHEPRLFITGVAGHIITFAPALTFDHLSVRDPDGMVRLLVDVANLSRNLVIRSENESRNQGHLATVGHDATEITEFNEFRGLGRTKAEILDSAKVVRDEDGKVVQIIPGKNQVGRYGGMHVHHAKGVGSRFVGNSLVGHPGTKWAAAAHNTSDVLIQWNVCVSIVGACYITEDANEVRTRFLDNFAAYVTGTASGFTGGSPLSNVTNPNALCPGCEGSGLWPRGLFGAMIERNHIWNSNFGVMVMPAAQPGQKYPGVPGGPIDTPMPDVPKNVPASFSDNVQVGNLFAGIDFWTSGIFPMYRNIAANNFGGAATAGPSANGVWMIDSLALCDNATSPGYHVNKPYVSIFRLEKKDGTSEVRGCGTGLLAGGGNDDVTVRDTLFQNVVDFDYSFEVNVTAGPLLIDSTVHKSLGGRPVRAIDLVQHLPWQPPAQEDDISACRQKVKNWMGTGKNYCLTPPHLPVVRDPFNAASLDNGAVAFASSEASEAFRAFSVTDGDRVGTDAGYLDAGFRGMTWKAATKVPAFIGVDFQARRTIDRITAIGMQDYYFTPEPFDAMRACTLYCLVDFDVQTWDGASWQTVEEVRGNDRVVRSVTFPARETERIRLNILKVGPGRNGEVSLVELEAHSTTAIAEPPPVSAILDGKGHRWTVSLTGRVFRNGWPETGDGVIGGASKLVLCEGVVHISNESAVWSKSMAPHYPAWEPVPKCDGSTPPPPPPPPPPTDTDGDGVPDTIDQCPDHPQGPVPGGEPGCPPPPPPPPPADGDGDGVPDASDQCPTEAAPGTVSGCLPVEPPPPPDSEALKQAMARIAVLEAALADAFKQQDVQWAEIAALTAAGAQSQALIDTLQATIVARGEAIGMLTQQVAEAQAERDKAVARAQAAEVAAAAAQAELAKIRAAIEVLFGQRPNP